MTQIADRWPMFTIFRHGSCHEWLDHETGPLARFRTTENRPIPTVWNPKGLAWHQAAEKHEVRGPNAKLLVAHFLEKELELFGDARAPGHDTVHWPEANRHAALVHVDELADADHWPPFVA